MTSFLLIDNPLSDDDAEPPTYMDACACKHGKQIPAVLCIMDGSLSVICAVCRLSFLFLDDLEAVNSGEIPMTLEYHDTTVSNPIVGTEYDGYWQLTVREVTP